jgi:hypothetical protein
MNVYGSLFRVDSFHIVNEIPESEFLTADTVTYSDYLHRVGRTSGLNRPGIVGGSNL